ncbi:Hypothetical protein NocV09_00302740 [Nannochloropsis oceanica]
MAVLASSPIFLAPLAFLFVLVCSLISPTKCAELVPDRWHEFEVPVVPEDKDYTQIKLNRIRDGHVAVNKHTDPSVTAELLVGDMLEAKGYTPEEIYAMQGVVSVLVKAGVLTVHADRLETADLSVLTKTTSTTGTPKRRKLQNMDGCCPCHVEAGHHPHPTIPPHYNKNQGGGNAAAPPSTTTTTTTAPADADARACERTLAGCAMKEVQLAADRRSMYKTMKAYGLALRRTAAARSYYLYVKEEVHSFNEFEALSKAEQEATREELAAHLLLTCKAYGLNGEELQRYGKKLGFEVPDLTKTSDAELTRLATEMASTHMMESVAKAMGKDLGFEALKVLKDSMGDAALRRIGVEPSPALRVAFGEFASEASRFITLSRQAMEAQNMLDPEIDEAYTNATAMADRLAVMMEKVNVTDLLVTATGLMISAEPYLTSAIDNPVDEQVRHKTIQPWEIILKLSQVEKAAQQQRKSFAFGLKEGNALDGLVMLHNGNGARVESPLMQQLDFDMIEDITADHMLDASELRYLVQRVGALNEIYTVDDFADLMAEVEENYREVKGLPPVYGQEESFKVGQATVTKARV